MIAVEVAGARTARRYYTSGDGTVVAVRRPASLTRLLAGSQRSEQPGIDGTTNATTWQRCPPYSGILGFQPYQRFSTSSSFAQPRCRNMCRMFRHPLRFALLGEVRAWHGDVELDLGPARQRCVLAVLLLKRGRDLTIRQLIDAVWGEEHPRTATSAVHTYLSRLRIILTGGAGDPGTVIERSRPGYRVAAGVTVDIDEFGAQLAEGRRALAAGSLRVAADHYTRALTHWGGVPFGTLTGPAVDAARTRLTEDHLCAVEEQADIELRLGNHDRQVPVLRGLVADHPLRERLWAALMVALYRTDRRGQAIAAYALVRQELADSLGVEPGPALRRLHRQLLSEDPALERHAAHS